MRVVLLGFLFVGAALVAGCDDGMAEPRVEANKVVYGADAPEDLGVEIPDLTPQECDFDTLVGQVYTDGLLGDIGKRPVRVLYPDSAATMDYSPERINVLIEKDTDVITAIRCG